MNLTQETGPSVTPRPSFPELLERLFADKHTGPVTVHFAQGVPNVIEIPGEATKIRLDKRARHDTSSTPNS